MHCFGNIFTLSLQCLLDCHRCRLVGRKFRLLFLGWLAFRLFSVLLLHIARIKVLAALEPDSRESIERLWHIVVGTAKHCTAF